MDIWVLDIGATTVNLLEAAVDRRGLVRQNEALRFVRLGEGTLASGIISQDAWHSTLSSLEELLERAQRKRPGLLLAVATSALREAANGPAFRKAIEQRLGMSVRVLTAREEAVLVYEGVRSALRSAGQPTVVIDLGGGTVNCALGHGDACLSTSALPLGVARLWPAFSPNGSLSPADARCLQALVRRSLAPLANQANELGVRQVVFSSAHARAVREYAMRRSAHAGPTGVLDQAAVRAACAEVVGTRPADLVGRGVPPERAASFPLATVLLASMMEVLCSPSALVADRGLLDGVALAAYAEAADPHHPRVA